MHSHKWYLFIPFHISVVFVCFLSSLLLCTCRNWFCMCSIIPFPVRMWHLYYRFPSFCCRPLMWVVSSEVGAIVPKSTIPNYTNEVRGEIIMTLGLATIGLALAIHTRFRLLMSSSESLFFEVWHWWVCSSSLDLRVVNKSCTLSVTCCQQILYTFSHMFSFTLVWTPFLKFVCNVCFWVRSDGFGLSLQVLVQKYLYYCIMFIDAPPPVIWMTAMGK